MAKSNLMGAYQQGLTGKFTGTSKPVAAGIAGLVGGNKINGSNLVGGGQSNLIGGQPTGNQAPQQEAPQQEETDPWMEGYKAFESQINAMTEAQKQALANMYGETSNMLNQNYDKNANNVYINYRQAQEKLPEQLSNKGATGGASESANIKLQNAYGTGLSENEYSRNEQLNSARQNYTQSVSELESGNASALANAYLQSAQQSAAYQLEQAEKKAAEEKQAAVDKWNNSVMENISKRQSQGYDVNQWEDNDGKIHYQIIGNSKKESAAIDNWNNNVQKNISKRVNEGYDVRTWTDNAGKLHYQITGKKKVTSGSSGSSGSSSRSASGSSSRSAGGSSSLPAVSSGSGNSSGSSSSKNSGGKINQMAVAQYVSKNAAKMISDPQAVVKDLQKKINNGTLTVAEANAIRMQFPTKKS